jgi:hypothetical protein
LLPPTPKNKRFEAHIVGDDGGATKNDFWEFFAKVTWVGKNETHRDFVAWEWSEQD